MQLSFELEWIVTFYRHRFLVVLRTSVTRVNGSILRTSSVQLLNKKIHLPFPLHYLKIVIGISYWSRYLQHDTFEPVR